MTHVHLTAPLEELERRYKKRPKHLRELASYEDVRENRTERNVDKLQKIADVVVDTHRSTADQVVVRVAARLGLYGRSYERLVDVLVGGAYGSEGKGQIAAYLAPEYQVLVRVGGPNAGHTVYEEPKPFTFHQLPSGTRRNPTARIVLGPGTVISVERLLDEIARCEISKDRLVIDPQAMLIDEQDLRNEHGLVSTIGSTGQNTSIARQLLRKVLNGRLAFTPRSDGVESWYEFEAQGTLEKLFEGVPAIKAVVPVRGFEPRFDG